MNDAEKQLYGALARFDAKQQGSLLPDKLTFRPGSLTGPLADRIRETGETPSQYLRRLIADDLGVKTPEMRRGNQATLKQNQQTSEQN